MTQQNEPREPVPAPEAPEGPPESSAPPPRAAWRDRVLGIRAVAAVALASLVLGGFGGAAIGAVSAGGDGHRDGSSEHFPGRPPGPGGHDDRLDPGGMPGQVPPGTTQEEDVSPDGSGDTTGATGGSNT